MIYLCTKESKDRPNCIQGVAKACTDFPRQELDRLHTERLLGLWLSDTFHLYNSWPSLIVFARERQEVWEPQVLRPSYLRQRHVCLWAAEKIARLGLSHFSCIKSLVLAVDGRQLLFHLNGIEAIRHSDNESFLQSEVLKTHAVVKLFHSWQFHGALLSGIRSITSHKNTARCNKTPTLDIISHQGRAGIPFAKPRKTWNEVCSIIGSGFWRSPKTQNFTKLPQNFWPCKSCDHIFTSFMPRWTAGLLWVVLILDLWQLLGICTGIDKWALGDTCSCRSCVQVQGYKMV